MSNDGTHQDCGGQVTAGACSGCGADSIHPNRVKFTESS